MKKLLSALALTIVLCLPLASQSQSVTTCPNGGCPSIQTAVSQAQKPPACVARVRVNYAEFYHGGTGTLLGVNRQHGLIVTNAHIFERNMRVKSIVIQLPEGTFEGRLLELDREWDVAAITISKPKAKPLPVADKFSKVGDTVWLYGYGPKGVSFRIISGRTQGYLATKRGGLRQLLEVSVPSRGGDSGGPMINSDGELVGVLSHTTDFSTTGACSLRVKACVDRFLAPWNAKAAIVETEAQAAREQALISLIRQNPGATDPALLGRISSLESQVSVIISQAQQFLDMKSEGPPPEVLPPSLPAPEPVVKVDPHASHGAAAIPVAATPVTLKWPNWIWSLLASGLGFVVPASAVGLVIWFLRRTGSLGRIAGAGARGVDTLTDWIPGQWDDKLLDPLAYRIAAIMGAKPKKKKKKVVTPATPATPTTPTTPS